MFRFTIRKFRISVILMLVLGAVLPLSLPKAYARPIPWTNAKLAETADCIVIATVEETRDGEFDLATDPIWKHFLVERDVAKAVGRRIAKLKVSAVLKGDLEQKTIEVKYVTLTDEVFVNGPTWIDLAHFQKKPNGEGAGASLLVFLKATPQRDFEPASGLFDPSYSFRELRGVQVEGTIDIKPRE